MKQFKRFNTLVGWLMFVIAAATYTLTLEPTTSFWDCGEFIATAFKLEVGHPPGAPLFLMLARFFALFAGSNTALVAAMINMLSALSSAFTILFLFWTITHLSRKLIVKNDSEITTAQTLAVLFAGSMGALAYTFSDTFWFSAVEGEVYALSSLFTAVVFWAILKWEEESDKKYANRWLILIAYLMGLSIGVHLLNLLAIPAIVYLVYFKKFKPNAKGILIAGFISVALLASIMYGVIQGMVGVAAKFELLFVNDFGLPFNSGLLIYLFLVISLFIISIFLSYQNKNNWLTILTSAAALTLLGIPFMTGSALLSLILILALAGGIYYLVENQIVVLNTLLLGFAVIFIGYTSYAMIVIRSMANPPMDENNPENVFALLAYLNREQYGDRPLFYGPTYNAPVIDVEDGRNIYIPSDTKYIVADVKPEYVYDERFMQLLPRMYSWQDSHKRGYESWADVVGEKITVDNGDKQEILIKPTFGENLKFLFNYQIGHMYFRYFLWNFVGRQNDMQGHGSLHEGNWLSGFPFIDNLRLIDQERLPENILQNKARNTYYFLPLIFGLLGLLFSYKHFKTDFWVVLLLFLFTGLAVVGYLNQTPYQPRERDYAYAGSFYAFSIWVGIGVLALYSGLKNKLNDKLSAVVSGVVGLLFVPTVLLSQNWDDHDRSNRYTARDIAINYLNSCEPNAILFTYGDNDTFPLWYVQEVEGVRTDVRVVNLSLLAADWYINQMKMKAYDSQPLPISMSSDKYVEGKRDQIPVLSQIQTPIDLKKAVDFIASDSPEAQIAANGKQYNYLPGNTFSLAVDSAKVVAQGLVPANRMNKIEKEIIWKLSGSLSKSDMIVLDILANNNWERPIYFAISAGKSSYLNLWNYFRQDGFAYRLVPYKAEKNTLELGDIDSKILYNRLMEKYTWGDMEKDNVLIEEHNLRVISLLNLRETFAALAIRLHEEGEKEKAEKVLERVMQIMPEKKFVYSRDMLPVIQAYYFIGDTKTANQLVKKTDKTAGDQLRYALALNPEAAIGSAYDAQVSMLILQQLMQLTEQYKQTDLQKHIAERFEQYYSVYEKLF
jgi:MFS family permease